MKKLYLSLVVILLSGIFLNACKKTDVDSNANPTPELPDLQTMISASASGFITNENDEPVQGVTVKLGTGTATTGYDGYFEITNVQVVKNAAVISVSQPGYFKAFRTYTAEEGKASFVRIKLSPKTLTGNINAVAGGSANVSNGLAITIPANAVVDIATGAAYNGSISVHAKWIDPASAEYIQTMPGSTRGLDKDGYMKVLSSYGITSVELLGDAGQALQIVAGKKATLTIPISSSSQTAAPATIPLWHLNEETGLWAEEGTALKSGNLYTAEVSHFSFWNCSWPANPVNFYINIVDSAGLPVPFAFVKLADVNDPGNSGGGFTDVTGGALGVVPANTTFTLTISNGYGCAAPVYTQQVQTGNGLTLNDLALPASAIATVSGTVIDCSMQAVSNGYISMNYEGAHSRFNLNQAGLFSFPTILCGNGVSARFVASDAAAQQASHELSYAINPGTNQLGNLQACGVNTIKYANYTINGSSVSMSSPQGVYPFGWVSNTNSTQVGGWDLNTNVGAIVEFKFPGTALGSDQLLTNFYGPSVQDSLSITSPIYVHITQYDLPGGFIAGNFAGTFTGRPPTNTLYNVSMEFKVVREF